RAMDVPVQQVMLEARIVEVSTDDIKKLGVDWDLLTRQGTIIVEGNPGPTPPNVLPAELGYVPFRTRPVINRQLHAIEAQIDLMIQEGHARVLANPKLATLNGRAANMLVGERIPYVISGLVNGASANTQFVQKEEVGVKLAITPIINSDGYITTVIQPEVSAVVGFKGIADDLPIVSTRQANTTVRLGDGSSVIIGGLLQEQKSTTISKVPILGSIPLLGYLFRHYAIETKTNDLVI